MFNCMKICDGHSHNISFLTFPFLCIWNTDSNFSKDNIIWIWWSFNCRLENQSGERSLNLQLNCVIRPYSSGYFEHDMWPVAWSVNVLNVHIYISKQEVNLRILLNPLDFHKFNLLLQLLDCKASSSKNFLLRPLSSVENEQKMEKKKHKSLYFLLYCSDFYYFSHKYKLDVYVYI